MEAQETPQIVFGTASGGLYVAFDGNATHQVCRTADKLVCDYLSAHEQPKVAIDLSGCDWVDSTFAGWMLGLRRRMAANAQGLSLANCSDACRAALERMHIGQLFQFAQASPPDEMRRVACSGAPKPDKSTLELMIQAHEQLAELDEENAQIFAPIVRMLRQQLAEAEQA